MTSCSKHFIMVGRQSIRQVLGVSSGAGMMEAVQDQYKREMSLKTSANSAAQTFITRLGILWGSFLWIDFFSAPLTSAAHNPLT